MRSLDRLASSLSCQTSKLCTPPNLPVSLGWVAKVTEKICDARAAGAADAIPVPDGKIGAL